jgi:hypothetical protein
MHNSLLLLLLLPPPPVIGWKVLGSKFFETSWFFSVPLGKILRSCPHSILIHLNYHLKSGRKMLATQNYRNEFFAASLE